MQCVLLPSPLLCCYPNHPLLLVLVLLQAALSHAIAAGCLRVAKLTSSELRTLTSQLQQKRATAAAHLRARKAAAVSKQKVISPLAKRTATVTTPVAKHIATVTPPPAKRTATLASLTSLPDSNKRIKSCATQTVEPYPAIRFNPPPVVPAPPPMPAQVWLKHLSCRLVQAQCCWHSLALFVCSVRDMPASLQVHAFVFMFSTGGRGMFLKY